MVRALARAVGESVYYFAPRRARWALVNARIAFPEAPERELRRIVRRSFGSIALDVVDLLRSENASR